MHFKTQVYPGFTFKKGQTTSSVRQNSELQIIPNLVSERFEIHGLDFLAHSSIRIYNLSGEIVMQKSTIQYRETVDCTSLPQGNYIVQIISNQKSRTQRIVKL